MPRSVLALFAFLLLAARLLVEDQPVAAQETPRDPGFTVQAEPGDDPSTTAKGYFVYELEPGKRTSGGLRLTNPTEANITIELHNVDAMTGANGGSAFATTDVEPASVGTWIELDKSRITLKPGKERVIGFTVRVPEDAAPGQYLAGLSAGVSQPANPEGTPATVGADQAGASIDLRMRYVIAVEIDVPGTWTPSLEVTGVRLIDQPSGPVIGIDLHNTGSIFLQPTGLMTLIDAQGTVVLEHAIQMGTFVTGTATTYPVPVIRALPPGSYQVRVDLTYGDGLSAAYENTIDIGVLSVQSATISGLAIEEVRSGADDTLQFVTVAVALENPGPAVANARLTLHVTRDGQPVEDIVLSGPMPLPSGPAQISQRYLPPTGWEPGTYAFSVTLETVDPATGTAVELASAQSETSVIVQ